MRCWAEIDLGKIRQNTLKLKETVGPKVELMAIVKANGYGHGALEVSENALASGATWLGVATVNEGMQLRSKGIDAPILVLSEPDLDEIINLIYAKLTPTVYSKAFIEELSKRAFNSYKVHLKVDTGMHRVGCKPEETLGLAEYADCRGLVIEGLMTHLATADSAGYYSDYQLALFEGVVNGIKTMGFNPIVHCANTAATLNISSSHYDMVRCGIGLYKDAMQLKSNVSFIQKVRAGESVGYDQKYRVSQDSYIGVVPLGYADGVPRRLQDTGGWLWYRGEKIPIVGVCMDMLLVDLSVEGGDPGEVILPLGDWPELLDTIDYEILCGIRKRVPRIYKEGR